ncbi:hypothetical protein GOV07_05055 [Candidatus Woesearchaeota archaeon]|nr:hypothetical protein [Candidatus Woesearchaeota archaeon]
MIFGKKKKEEPKGEVVLDKEEKPKPKEGLTEAQIKEQLSEGWLRVLITFELVGKPREHIEATIKSYLANIKQDKRIKAIKEEFAEAIEMDDGLFSTFCEFETMVENMEVLTWLAVNFMPASIEILSPDKLTLDSRVIVNWVNDLLAKLHEVSNVLREERAVNAHVTKGMNALIKNSILAALKTGELTPADLEKIVGIQAAQLVPFLENLLEKGTIIQKNKKYSLP